MPTVYNKVTAGGSTLIDLSQDTVTSASDIVSGKIGHLADGTQVTGTGGGGNDFVVSLSKNNQTGYWEPDKTWSEVSAAIADNKTFVFCIAGMTGNSELAADGVVFKQQYTDDYYLIYIVYETLQDQSNNYYTDERWYSFKSAGVTEESTYTYYDTSNANATSADILSGKTAFNSSGSVSGSIPTKTSSDLTASGATVSVPAGYYGTAASKAVASGSASTPATTITANPSISIDSSGLITATTSATQSVTPTVSAGYISSGTSGTITVSGSNTEQLSVQAGATITPTTSEQTAVAAGKFTTGAVKVAAMTSGTAGTPTATKGTVSNHSIFITPSVTNTTGYITGSTINGTAVSVSASELVSGSETKTSNGTYDVTNLAELIVNVSGGVTVKTASGTFTGDGSRDISFTCSFEPDVVYWYTNAGTSTFTGTVSGLIFRGKLAANRYANNSTSRSANIQDNITEMNTGGSSYNFRATYSNGTVTLYCFSSNARSQFKSGQSYDFWCMKYTS